jgi:predicted NUDIX family NTP pyrophosphohydrolase
MAAERMSAGLLMYRVCQGQLEVFLAHPGGPFFRKKEEGHWSIPKGEIEPGEPLLDAARREFAEEIGMEASGPFLPLGTVKQKGGKIVHAWAFAGDWEEGRAHVCNSVSIEWPPGCGRWETFPEVDRVSFFPVEEARKKLKASQHPFLDRLMELIEETGRQ